MRQRTLVPPVEYLLALACMISAVVLAGSEFLTTFEFTPPGGEPLQASEAADRHGHALLLVAVFALIALTIALVTGSKPAAAAVAAAGGVAMLVFLIADLPDAGRIGTLDDPRQSFIDAEAVPQAGFWLELLGSVSLTVSGAALATLRTEQLAVVGRWAGFRAERQGPFDQADAAGAEPGEAERTHARRAARRRERSHS